MQLWQAIMDVEAAVGAAKTGFPSALSQTGEPYTVITSCGVHIEGHGGACVYLSEAEAVEAWKREAMEFIGDKHGVLYWRSYPKLESPVPETFRVYSRFLVSDKSPDCIRRDRDEEWSVHGRDA